MFRMFRRFRSSGGLEFLNLLDFTNRPKPPKLANAHSAFTIVELMMVAGIIIILMGVVTTAAAQSIRSSRSRRADALCSLVQAGMNAYYARYDQWPGSIGSQIANGTINSGGNREGAGNTTDNDKYVLSGTEVRSCVKALVDASEQMIRFEE